MFPLSCHPRLTHQAKDQSAQACGQSKRQRLSSDRFSHREVVAGRCQVTLEVIEASWRRAQQLTGAAPAVAGWKGGAQLAGGQAAALEVALRRKKYDLQQQAPATAVSQTDPGHHHQVQWPSSAPAYKLVLYHDQ